MRHTGTLSSTKDTELRVWYNGVSHISNTDLGGQNRTWRDYQTVLHMGTTEVKNSTGKHDKLQSDGVSVVDGMVGKGLRFATQGIIGNHNNLNVVPNYHEAFLGDEDTPLDGYTLQIAINSDDFDDGERCIFYQTLFKHVELCMKPIMIEGVSGHQLIYRHQGVERVPDDRNPEQQVVTYPVHTITTNITTQENHLVHLIWNGQQMRLNVDLSLIHISEPTRPY